MLFLSFDRLCHIIMGQVSYILQMMLQLSPNHHLHTLLFYLALNLNFLAQNLDETIVFFLENLKNLLLSFDYSMINCYECFKWFRIRDWSRKFEDLVDMNFCQTHKFWGTQRFPLLYSSLFNYIILAKKDCLHTVNPDFLIGSNYLFNLRDHSNSKE